MTQSYILTNELEKYLVPAFERKAQSIAAIDVNKLTSYTDLLVIIEGRSQRQVRSIADHLIKSLKKTKLLGVEGIKEGKWVLLDYGHIIFHVLDPKTKSFYNLEGLWSDAPRIDLSKFQKSKGKKNDL